MKNEKQHAVEQDQELSEPELEKTEGGLIGSSPLLKGKLADPRPSPIFEVEF